MSSTHFVLLVDFKELVYVVTVVDVQLVETLKRLPDLLLNFLLLLVALNEEFRHESFYITPEDVCVCVCV